MELLRKIIFNKINTSFRPNNDKINGILHLITTSFPFPSFVLSLTDIFHGLSLRYAKSLLIRYVTKKELKILVT